MHLAKKTKNLWSLAACALALSIASISCAKSPEPLNAEQAQTALHDASLFAIGGVGVAGTVTSGEHAFRAILAQKDAATRFAALLKDESALLPGRMYALLGLRLSDRSAYQQALPAYLKRSDLVANASGCMMYSLPASSIAQSIETGQWDSVSKER